MAKTFLIILIVVLLILKILTIFNFSLDAWSIPELFTLVTPVNVSYYGGIGILANVSVFLTIDINDPDYMIVMVIGMFIGSFSSDLSSVGF